jgi:hypothetical protein
MYASTVTPSGSAIIAFAVEQGLMDSARHVIG